MTRPRRSLSGVEDETTRLRRLRKAADRFGLTLRKARHGSAAAAGHAGYMLVNSATSIAVLGFEPPYSASLDEIEKALTERSSSAARRSGAGGAGAKPSESLGAVRGLEVRVEGVHPGGRVTLVAAEATPVVLAEGGSRFGRAGEILDVATAVLQALRVAETLWFGTGDASA